MAPTKDEVMANLSRVALPGGGDLGGSGLVRALAVADSAVRFVIEAPSAEEARALEPVRAAAESMVRAMPGVTSVSAVLTAHGPATRAPQPAPSSAPPSLTIGRHPTPNSGPQRVAGVDRILAVGSGKGGVGKSTVASNLAVALAREGRRVGLLDADIYGPSQPRMRGVSKRPASPDGKTIEPLRAHGVTMMSIGLMVDPDKAIDMFRTLKTPVLGLIENMSTFVCPNCGHESHVFGHGGVEAEARKDGIPFLGRLPIDLQTRISGDEGVPVAAGEGPMAEAWRGIARRLVEGGMA